MKNFINKILSFIKSALSDDESGGSATRLIALVFSVSLVVSVFWGLAWAYHNNAFKEILEYIGNLFSDLIKWLFGFTVTKHAFTAVSNAASKNPPPPTSNV